MSSLQAQRWTTRQVVLKHIRESKDGLSSRDLSDLSGLSQRSVVTLCHELIERRLVAPGMQRNPRTRLNERVWRAVNANAFVAPRTAFPFRPLQAPRPTIIPVRSGGRIAPDISTDARVSFGVFTKNPYHPLKETTSW